MFNLVVKERYLSVFACLDSTHRSHVCTPATIVVATDRVHDPTRSRGTTMFRWNIERIQSNPRQKTKRLGLRTFIRRTKMATAFDRRVLKLAPPSSIQSHARPRHAHQNALNWWDTRGRVVCYTSSQALSRGAPSLSSQAEYSSLDGNVQGGEQNLHGLSGFAWTSWSSSHTDCVSRSLYINCRI